MKHRPGPGVCCKAMAKPPRVVLLLALALGAGGASAFLQVDVSPAVNWLSTCMQRETGLDIVPFCQDVIADSSSLAMRALVDPQNTTKVPPPRRCARGCTGINSVSEVLCQMWRVPGCLRACASWSVEGVYS